MAVQCLLLTATCVWSEILRNLCVLGQAPKLSQKVEQEGLHPSQKDRGVTEEVHLVWILSELKWAVSDAAPRGFISHSADRAMKMWDVQNWHRDTHFPDLQQIKSSPWKIRVLIFNKLLNAAHPDTSKRSVYMHMQRNWMPKWLVFMCCLVVTGIQITFWMQNQFCLSPWPTKCSK